MPLISESFQKNKLNKLNINIKTKYITEGKILEKNTNDSYNDDIIQGIRCEKEYYLGKKLIHKENVFDSRIEYTYISKDKESEDYTCPNCKMHSKLKDFIDNCPYCNTHCNIDYSIKKLGGKYYYDLVLKNKSYRIITFIIDLLTSIILSYIFIKSTSRTFNIYDISKVFIYGLILSLILYYFFYIIDAYIILGPIKKYKEKQNQKQRDFWNNINISKKTFFNNFNYELSRYFYENLNIIDYDVLDFTEFNSYKKNDTLYITTRVDIRIVKYENNKITSKIINEKYTLKQINKETKELNSTPNIIKCSNCGSSIDITKENCEYCGTKIKYYQEFILDNQNII